MKEIEDVRRELRAAVAQQEVCEDTVDRLKSKLSVLEMQEADKIRSGKTWVVKENVWNGANFNIRVGTRHEIMARIEKEFSSPPMFIRGQRAIWDSGRNSFIHEHSRRPIHPDYIGHYFEEVQ